jgi:hypothetical protein
VVKDDLMTHSKGQPSPRIRPLAKLIADITFLPMGFTAAKRLFTQQKTSVSLDLSSKKATV